jgi:hypothetical protein
MKTNATSVRAQTRHDGDDGMLLGGDRTDLLYQVEC